jgi:hypothetical protein
MISAITSFGVRKPEAFAGTVVEVVLGGLDLLAGALAQVGALGKELAE